MHPDVFESNLKKCIASLPDADEIKKGCQSGIGSLFIPLAGACLLLRYQIYKSGIVLFLP